MKTILEHFQDFPVEWRDEAIARLKDSENAPLHAQVATPALALSSGFYWAKDDEPNDEWEKWNKRHKQLIHLENYSTPPTTSKGAVVPEPLSNTNLLIGCLFEIQKTAAEAREEGPYDCTDIMDSIMLNIDSCLSSLSPPCDMSKWNNNYPS
jgi:hypothetical protein